jgi:hypothetical protein
MYYVYILVCLQTGRFYVGETDEHSAGQQNNSWLRSQPLPPAISGPRNPPRRRSAGAARQNFAVGEISLVVVCCRPLCQVWAVPPRPIENSRDSGFAGRARGRSSSCPSRVPKDAVSTRHAEVHRQPSIRVRNICQKITSLHRFVPVSVLSHDLVQEALGKGREVL